MRLKSFAGAFKETEAPLARRQRILERPLLSANRYFLALVFLPVAFGIYAEYVRGEPVLLALDAISACFCFAPWIFRPRSHSAQALICNGTFFLLTILEMETQFRDPAAEFYSAPMYIINPLIMTISSFLFVGTPDRFLWTWLVIWAAYLFRTGMAWSPNVPASPAVSCFANQGSLAVFLVLVNRVWHRFRAGRLNQMMTARARSRRQLAEQRSSIFKDLHDHLGAAVTDLSVLAHSLRPGMVLDESLVHQWQQSVRQLSVLLRNRLTEIDDRDRLEEDLLVGLRVILGRRFAQAGRRVIFDMPPSSTGEPYGTGWPARKIAEVFAICTEICSNSLKYGTGDCRWAVLPGAEMLEFHIECACARPEHTGFGSSILRERARRINAQIHERIEEGIWKLHVAIPNAT